MKPLILGLAAVLALSACQSSKSSRPRLHVIQRKQTGFNFGGSAAERVA